MDSDETAAETIPAWWQALVGQRSDEEMLRDNGRSVSFAEIDRRAEGIARGLLAHGAGKGTRVAILFPNRAEWLVSWLAVSRIGGIAVTLSTFFAPPEIAYTLAHADVAFVLSAREYLGHRYDERLAAAIPDLAECAGDAPLALPQCPHLRGIWFDERSDAPWSAGGFDDLIRDGETSPVSGPEMFAAVERAVSPADLALLMYTSGSTAAPKGVVHTQATVAGKIAYMARINAIIPNEIAEGDRTLINMPMFWVGGFLSVTAGAQLGATILFEDDHSPATMLWIVREQGVTHVSGSEAVLRSLTDVPGFRSSDLVNLKAQCTPQLAFIKQYGTPGSDRETNSLGMTETLGPHSGDPDFRLQGEAGAGNFGFALEGMEYRIVDPETGAVLPPDTKGELALRGQWLMDGFYKQNRADVFDANGFYRTGDQCTLRADGVLLFHGRYGGMIKTSGANVSAEEVERLLMEHPAVLDGAVIGISDPERGQSVVAVLAIRDGSELTEADVRAWLKPQLSAFKVPRRVLFRALDSFPRTPSNKIRKPLLAEAVAQDLRTDG